MLNTAEIRIPKVDLEELLVLIRGFGSDARRRIAPVLAESEMDARMDHLIRQIAAGASHDDISDVDINAEIAAVRQADRSN